MNLFSGIDDTKYGAVPVALQAPTPSTPKSTALDRMTSSFLIIISFTVVLIS